MKFYKMEACGNDYIYILGEAPKQKNAESIIRELSDRHFGIGGDGVVFIEPSRTADLRMRMFNRDGSEGLMCGNAARCVGKLAYDVGLIKKDAMTLQTESGIKKLSLKIEDNCVKSVTAEMGKAVVNEIKSKNQLKKGEKVIEYASINVGNPHAVVFEEEIAENEKEWVITELNKCPGFKNGINVEFVARDENEKVHTRVYERGTGWTMSCGTGACAVAVACVKHGWAFFDKEVEISLPGGSLYVTVHHDYTVDLTGECHTVYEGEIAWVF